MNRQVIFPFHFYSGDMNKREFACLWSEDEGLFTIKGLLTGSGGSHDTKTFYLTVQFGKVRRQFGITYRCRWWRW